MSMLNQTTLNMLSTKYQNPSTKGVYNLTIISKNESSFNREKHHYQEALSKGYHKHDLKYNASNDRKTKKKRKNNLYFTSPFCLSVETKIDKRFSRNCQLKLLSMHPYHKIFKRKLLKISYSCMPNIKSQIISHNRKMLEDKVENKTNATAEIYTWWITIVY